MVTLFSAREIAEAAVEKERKRREFYKKVHDLTDDKDMKGLFKFLAEEEDRHIKIFEQIRDELPEGTHSSDYTEDMQAYMDSVVDDRLYSDIDSKDFIRKAIETKDVFRLAMGFEKDAILYFREFLPYLSEPDKRIVDELIEQEKDHLRKLAEMKRQMEG